jgi:hypothetical protein
LNADFDTNSLSEIIVSTTECSEGGVSILRNVADHEWDEKILFAKWPIESMAEADVDSDGDLDLVLGAGGGRQDIWLGINDGTGRFVFFRIFISSLAGAKVSQVFTLEWDAEAGLEIGFVVRGPDSRFQRIGILKNAGPSGYILLSQTGKRFFEKVSVVPSKNSGALCFVEYVSEIPRVTIVRAAKGRDWSELFYPISTNYGIFSKVIPVPGKSSAICFFALETGQREATILSYFEFPSE